MTNVSATQYRRVIVAAGILLTLIILSGAAVRLTQSGLGCDDWPKCSEEAFVPEWAFHSWIEFGNRLISGLIALVVVAAALSTYWRLPRRPDLVPWAWGLVAMVVVQIVLGGVTVWVDLHPIFVSVHFLLSIELIWNVIVLWVKAKADPEEPPRLRVSPKSLNLSRTLLTVATAVLVVGTLVTGTGPNSGDASAVRLSFDLRSIARFHSATAWVLVAVVLMLVLALRKDNAATNNGTMLLFITLAQGGIGYLQYAMGAPAGLVELHIAGSLAVWITALWLHLGLFVRTPEMPYEDKASATRVSTN